MPECAFLITILLMECVKKLNVESERRHTHYIHTGEAELQHRSKGKNEKENKLAVRNIQTKTPLP